LNEQKKQKLLEQYDDAAFALLMDEYAEEEGARLMAEFEAAQAAGQVPEMPQTLDEQCRRMIRRNSAKKRGKQAARRFGKVAVKAAVAVLVFLGLVTTVVMSVDALRIPVLNFIVEQYEKYSSLQLNNDAQNTDANLANEYLLGLLPDDYYIISKTDDPIFKITMYENDIGDLVQFCITQTNGTYNIDTEDAIVSEIVLGDYKAILLEEDGYQAIWYDSANSIVYNFRATGFTKETFLNLCEQLAELYG
jgi:hypothetical protein